MSQVSFPKLEEEILDWWEREDIFQKSLAKESPMGEFVFYEGPPTANGKPGIHHILARAFKDLIPRYKTMRGWHVMRKAGWDTHGLPVELQVEKKLGITGKPEIENLKGSQTKSIEYFNEQCKSSVWQYKEDWEKLTRRMGFWIDMNDPYVTYDNDYIESLWWIIKEVYNKKLLYKGHKVVPHCPRCGTTLSSHEVAQGYREITEPSVFLKFKVKVGNDKVKVGDYILSWTTTPWTLPGNVALAVGEDFTYIKIRIFNNQYIDKKPQYDDIIVAKNIYEKWKNDPNSRMHDLIFSLKQFPSGKEIGEKEKQIGLEFKGKDMIGVEYEPLFPGAIPETVDNYQNAFKVYSADFVTTEDGTGIVHTAVMYGEDDYNLGERIALPKYHTVTEDGKFQFVDTKGILGKLDGLDVKHKDKELENKTTDLIIKYLKSEKLRKLWLQTKYTHDYPFCWRCDTPLLYYAKDSWFIKMSSLRKDLIKNNKDINWVPAHIKEGRFGEWLDGVKDWAISRERFWGTPLPVWECKECGEVKVVGSRAELKELKSDLADDIELHRPFIDAIKFSCPKCQAEMIRDSSVLDCWFDAGAMPFAQIHYPFDNRELIDKEKLYPADYISEAIDQTRGWFYTLLAISTLLGKGTCYKNVICLGHINDKQGKKMSKRLNNIVDPGKVIDTYGVDALRWHFYTMNQPGEPKNFDPLKVGEVVKKKWLILWNVLSFYKLYASQVKTIKKYNPTDHIMDQWILAKLSETTIAVTDNLDRYDITSGARKISEFINELSTWYIRRSRDRFKAGGNQQLAAVVTLGRVLLKLSKLLAPFVPFLAEKLYQELTKHCPVKQDEFKQSVHLETWPDLSKLTEEQKVILAQGEIVRQIVEQALSMRAELKIKLRQPLSKLQVPDSKLPQNLLDVIKDEINVKEVVIGDSLKLDTVISEELRLEGIFREVVRSVNTLRKQAGLTINDTVDLMVVSDSMLLKEMLKKYKDELKKATLVKAIITEKRETENFKEIKIIDSKVWLGLVK